MEDHFQSIRVAITAPSEEARQAARAACRALLQVLEAAPPAPSAAPSEAPSFLRVVPTAAEDGAGTSAQSTGPQPPVAAASAPRDPDPVLCDPTEVPPPAAPVLPPMALPPSLAPLLAGAMGGSIDPSHVAALVAAAQTLKPEQWVDLLLSKLQTLLGSRISLQPRGGGMGALPTAPVAAAPRQPFHFQIVPIPPGWTNGPAKGRK